MVGESVAKVQSEAAGLPFPVPTRARRRIGSRFGLLTETELADEGLVAVLVAPLDVVEHLATPTDHLQQPTAGAVVLLVGLEVALKVVDAGRQQRHLDLGAAGIPM